jgi:hypothetical protein
MVAASTAIATFGLINYLLYLYHLFLLWHFIRSRYLYARLKGSSRFFFGIHRRNQQRQIK